MGDLLKDVDNKDQTSAEASALRLDSPLEPDGKTVQGNDPRLELHYPTELDPNRALPENGYPYLDRVEREKAEVQRAYVEGRDPDLDNPGPNAGNPLRSAAQLANPMNSVQANIMGKAEPAAVLDAEDSGLVEAEDGSLVARGTVVGPGQVTENEFGQRVPISEDAQDPEAVKEQEAEQEEQEEEETNDSDVSGRGSASNDSSDSSDSGSGSVSGTGPGSSSVSPDPNANKPQGQ